jgi:hypothetical protein
VPTLSQVFPVGLSTSFWGSMMTTAVSLLPYLTVGPGGEVRGAAFGSGGVAAARDFAQIGSRTGSPAAR